MDPTKTASIGTQLSPTMDAALRKFLRKNWDIFAWHPSDMSGIPCELAEHSLNILKGYKPVKQTLRHFSEPKRQAMGEELAKLLEAGFIRDIKHPDWLANLVMVNEEGKILAPMRRLQRPQQGLPQGSLPPPLHRPNHRRHRRTRLTVFPRCILWIPSNKDGRVRPSCNSFHNAIWPFLLQHYAFRA